MGKDGEYRSYETVNRGVGLSSRVGSFDDVKVVVFFFDVTTYMDVCVCECRLVMPRADLG